MKKFIQLESAQKIHASSVMSKEKEQNKRERKKEEVHVNKVTVNKYNY